jgi:uncharacterized protein DUF4157/HNH/ENDO VII superfamily nuclease
MATAARVFQAPAPAPPPKIVAPEVPRPRSTRTPDAVSRRLAPAVRMGTAASAADNQPMSTATGGQPLAPAVRMAIEDSYQVDLRGVRVHSDSGAVGPSARAFTHGSNIVLGPGESPDDLTLMAHEAAHVVQQQSAPVIQRYTPGGGDSYEHEAHQASAAVVRGETFHIQQRTSPRTQRLSLSDIRDYIADKANIIPGFRMFTIVIGVNPINGAEVDRSPGNILRAIIEFIPFGGLVTQALNNYGIFDKIGNWVAQQIKSLGMVGSSFVQAISDFISSLGIGDFARPGATWERAKAIFTGPIDQLISFAEGLLDGIVAFIKEAILKPLAALAEGTPGWALLTAVLGKNPITGEKVTPTADNLIGPFMTLIGQEEIWENMKKANAVARAFAWFKGALNGLLSFVEQIPDLFISTLKSLEIVDLIVPPLAFIKVGKAFGGFLAQFTKWALDQVIDLLKIIFAVVAPGAMPYLQKVGAAFNKILKDPISFVGNLVKAGKMGFQSFAANIGAHLKRAFLEWLTGSLPGIYIPKALSLKEFALLALSVLGITWANIRQKLVKATSENIVKGLEVGFAIVKKLVTEGPAAAWEEIKSQLTNLKDMVMEGIMNFIIETVVKKAVAKVLSLLVPGGAFIQAIISIYDTVMVFIAKLKKIIQVAMAFLDSMMAIANGVLGAAAAKVESTLAGLLVLAISFLAGFLGLNKIADKVMDIINTKVRAPVDKAIDFVINWIVTTAKNLFKALFGKKDAKPDERTDAQKKADLHQGVMVAQGLLKAKDATATSVQAKLPPIQSKFRLTSLTLVDTGGNKYRIDGAVNPDEKGDVVSLAGTWPVAVGDHLKVPESNLIEKVISIDGNKTITYSASARAAAGTSTKSYEKFMDLWNSGVIRKSGEMSADELRAELTRLYGAQVADAIMRRGELATNVGVTNPMQAHHIIPIEILKKQGIMQLLVRTGWNFNQKINGIPLQEGFHGNHPQYTAYVSRKVDQWVQQNGSSNAAAFQSYVENTLIPHLISHINTAKARFVTTKETLNDYFARL